MPWKSLIAGLLAAVALALPELAAAAEAFAGERMALPRGEDGAIDVAAILHNIRARIAAGAREIMFRGDMKPDEAKRLILQGRLLEDIASRLPDDGVEREVRLRGIVDARVQRSAGGELRAKIEGVHLGSLAPAQRHDLARRIALQSGVDRVRIHGLDATGDRVRVDYRVERPERPERVERAKVERPERIDRPERIHRAERVERPERPERPDRPERHSRR